MSILGARSGMRQMQGGVRNPPGAYWVVREEGFRSDNAADGRSWTGSQRPCERAGHSGMIRGVIDDLSSPPAPPAPRAAEDPSGIRTTTSTTFHSLPIAPQVLEGVDRLGYTHCTPIQEQTLPITLAGKDVAGQAQTGTGKTAAFLIRLFTRL